MPLIKLKTSPYWHLEITRDGRRTRRSLGVKSRREAERLVKTATAELEAEIIRERVAQLGDLTLDQAAGLYWSQVASRLSENSQAAYKHHLQILRRIIGAALKMSEIKTAHVADYVAKRQEAGRAPATIKTELTILRAMHTRARDVWDCPVQNIAWRAVTPKVDNTRFRTLTREQAIALGEALPERLRPAYWWSLATGCRIEQETARITVGDVNWQARTVHIVRKGGRPADLPLSDAALQILERLGVRDMEPSQLVFVVKKYTDAFHRARNKVGLPDFRWHDLRHVHATWLRQSGVPIEIVQRLLGHQNISTTVSRYAHVEQQELHDGVARLELPTDNDDETR